MTSEKRYIILNSLTRELANINSPVRQFFGTQFTSGLKDVQRRFREAKPSQIVATVPRAEANPGTVGTAADWLLRFLLYPEPDLILAAAGAALCEQGNMLFGPALAEIAESLAVPLPTTPGAHVRFTGPVLGSTAPPELLARSSWALALLTEAFRAGAEAAAMGPLGQFRGFVIPTAGDLLDLAPPAGLDQLTSLRQVFETALIPQLKDRSGLWALGPTFTGSALMNADADLIAAGLLLDLKTSAKLSLAVTDLFQVIGYALLDFDDEFGVSHLGIFSARYAHLATWELGGLLDELAGHDVSLQATREQFHRLLLMHQPVG